MATSVRLAGLAAAGLALTSCGAAGGEVGYNAYTTTDTNDMPQVCEEFLGSPEDVAKKLDLDIELFDEPSAGECRYVSQADDEVRFTIETDKPSSAIAFGKGEKYYLALRAEDTEGNDLKFSSDVRKDISQWLQEKADQITDDYDEWFKGLPAVTEDYASAEATYTSNYEDEDGEGENQATLFTPAGEVVLATVEKPKYLGAREVAERPADDHKFIAPILGFNFDGANTDEYGEETAPESDASVLPTFSIEVDGATRDSAKEALAGIVSSGATGSLVLSIPKDAKDVSLVATTGELVQKLSLLTGKIDDNGFSKTYAENHVVGTSDGDFTAPEAKLPDGDTREIGGWSSWRADYSETMKWRYTPWDPVKQQLAPADKMFFTVILDPVSPEAVEPLTAADMTVEINGKTYKATNFDPKAYTYNFEVPKGAQRFNVTLKTKILVKELKDEYWYKPGTTLTGPAVNTWTVDPNNVD
ncbi:hypothetical protein [Nocardioides yefusunii]|uniref:Lipoprotein n=1 Tax=Nocardioides yefusunii TaxID=2500546 RepID=A0ABW1QWL3_9ACTN|nr:hypothetical protein [Nocardioides yefusunii]